MAFQSYDGYEQIIDEIKARVNRSFAEYDKYNSDRPYDIDSPINSLLDSRSWLRLRIFRLK